MSRAFVRFALLILAVVVVLIAVPFAVQAARPAATTTAVIRQQGTVPGTVPGTIPQATPDAEPTATAAPTPTRPLTTPYRPPRRPAAASAASSAMRDGTRLFVERVPVRTLIGDAHSDVLYALTLDGRLHVSENGGRTWELRTTEPQLTDFHMSAADPTVLYAGNGVECSAETGSAPFLKSTDGGVRWETLPTAAGLIPLLLHPADADTVLAADCDLPFMTDNGGAAWNAKPDISPERIWTKFYAVAAAATTLADESAPALDYLYVAGVAREGRAVLVYSGDAGATWTRITPRMNPAPVMITAVAADRRIPGRVWFADENGIWATDDFGGMWTLQNAGLDGFFEGDDGSEGDDESEGGDAPAVTSLLYAADHGLLLGTRAGLYFWEDGAEAWTPVGVGELEAPAVEALLVLDSAPDTLWVTTAQGVYTVTLP